MYSDWYVEVGQSHLPIYTNQPPGLSNAGSGQPNAAHTHTNQPTHVYSTSDVIYHPKDELVGQ